MFFLTTAGPETFYPPNLHANTRRALRVQTFSPRFSRARLGTSPQKVSLEKVGVLVTGNQNTGQTQKTKFPFAANNAARKTPSVRWLPNCYASATLCATAFGQSTAPILFATVSRAHLSYELMEAWDAFEAEFLNANSWALRKDGPPLRLLDKLSASEKARAETELLNRLDAKDDWPILGLAHLNSQKAVPLIRKLVRRAPKACLPAIAEALFRLTGDTSLEPKLIALARSRWAHFGHRSDAALALDLFPTESAQEALREVADRGDYLVSYNAKRALRRQREGW